MKRMTIILPEDIAARVKAAVKTGHYCSISELIHQALRDWGAAEAGRADNLKNLRKDVNVGIEQATTGQARPFDTKRIVGLGKSMGGMKP